VSAELGAWLRLTLIPGVAGDCQRQLLKAFGSPQAVFSAAPSALREVAGAEAAARLLAYDCDGDVASALAWTAEPGNHVVTLADADYPRALLDSPDPPTVLYARGRLEFLNRPALAIVGSRSATPQGEANAEAFAAALTGVGLAVISGLALGIDAAAHRGALKAEGATIAVVGTGADRIYPSRNEVLAREIAKRGLLISEFPLGTPARAANFPRRNRIIAGLALGCLVVEAAERSGSLITARLAGEAGREVFAVPGSIHSPQAKGCHKLIRQGAKLVESAQDILEELRWSATSPKAPEGAPAGAEGASLLARMGHDPVDLDTLATRTGLTADGLLAMLLPLELEGRVAQLPGGRYQRIQ